MSRIIINTSEIDARNETLWQSRYSDTEDIASEAEKLLELSEKNNFQKGAAYSRLNIAAGNFFRSVSNESILRHLSDALLWFSSNKHEKGYARALIIKGNIYESFGEYEKALQLWLEAYKAAVASFDAETEGDACSQLGLIYTRLSNIPKALEYYMKGLKIREDLGDENAVASSLNRIGMVKRQAKEYDESLAYYFRSLEIREKNRQFGAIPWTLLGIANTYEEQAKLPEALHYYTLAMNDGDKRCSLQCKMGAGRIYSKTGDGTNAEKMLEESLSMASELNSLFLIAEAHSALAAHYELFNNPARALESFKQYLDAKESLQSTEIQSRLSNIEVSHAIEKSEQEKEIYRLRHVELKQAYDIIEEKNRDITSSISYASRIQKAILPDPREIRGLSGSSFILLIPRDIVSGDFYWFTMVRKKLIIAAGDCTGHGVPGALMSMLGISFLEEIVNNRCITESNRILDELRMEVKRALKQKGSMEEAKDGMDISLCTIDREKRRIQFSGAYNNMYLFREGILTEYAADHMPIGIYDREENHFSSEETDFLPGDMIYLFSDGFADQFGGPAGKKFKYASFKALLAAICSLPLKTQKKKLETEFLSWKGTNPQTDDVLVIGLKL